MQDVVAHKPIVVPAHAGSYRNRRNRLCLIGFSPLFALSFSWGSSSMPSARARRSRRTETRAMSDHRRATSGWHLVAIPTEVLPEWEEVHGIGRASANPR